MRIFLVPILMCCGASLICRAQDTTTFRARICPGGSATLHQSMPGSIGPDAACIQIMKYGSELAQSNGIVTLAEYNQPDYSDRWDNKVGGEFCLIEIDDPSFTLTIGATSFINLHDFSRQDFSWQLWRGNLGGKVMLGLAALDHMMSPRARVRLELGWNHESEHATDLAAYRSTYLNGGSYSNGDFASFEYYTVALHTEYAFTSRLASYLVFGTRFFPPPIRSDAHRAQTSAISIESQVSYDVASWACLYGGIYLERIYNTFYSAPFGFVMAWNAEPFTFQYYELGLRLHNATMAELYFQRRVGNGRGLDFLTVYSDMTLGARICL